MGPAIMSMIMGMLSSKGGGSGGQGGSGGGGGIMGTLNSMPSIGGAAMGGLMGMMTPNISGNYTAYANGLKGLAKGWDSYKDMGTEGTGDLKAFDKENAANIADPMAQYNKIASTWKASPYQNNMMHGVQSMMNNNNAMTGMMGSKQANDGMQSDLGDMMNKYQGQYVNSGLGQYDNALNHQFAAGQYDTGVGMQGLSHYNNLMQEGLMGDLQSARAGAQWKTNMLGDTFGGLMSGHQHGLP